LASIVPYKVKILIMILIIKKNTIALTIISSLFCWSVISCSKMAEVETPYTTISSENIFSTDATAVSVLTGIYAKLANEQIGFVNSTLSGLSFYTSLSSDELVLQIKSNLNNVNFYTNSLKSNPISPDYWTSIFGVVYKANAAIEGLNKSTTLTPKVKQQLLGEAKFMRAFCYFYLTNLFGDVPLVVSTDYSKNAILVRESKEKVYLQIVGDLKDAQNLLGDKFLKGDALTEYTLGSEERVRPTKWAATALLARTYLYTQDWGNAEIEATKVIENTSLFTLQPLVNTFKKNNKEAIWQLQSVGTGTSSNTGEGRLFILPASGPGFSNPVYLSTRIVNSFELNDKRKTSWVDSVKPASGVYYYPAKYKIGSVNTSNQEYCTVIRLAELFLIRAEARAQQNKISEAQVDINQIRARAQLANTTAGDKPSLLTAIMQERKVELFTEWGHRWFDLKRTGNVDATMSIVTPIKGGTWETTDRLYPIPATELTKAPQLTQNPGYN
jgi:hypothetical protein